MEDKVKTEEQSSIEDIINYLPEVISSKVVFNNDKIIEVHVLAGNKRNPKQISRDIQSALTAKFGLSIDHKKISIAQIEFKKDLLKDFRLVIKSINYSTKENIAEVSVILQKGMQKVEGMAQGTNTTYNSHRLLACATLNCVHNLLNISNAFVIEDIEKILLAKREIITVAVSFLSPSMDEELLVGSAIVKKDIKESIVKATLDAINRKIVKVDS